MAGVMEKSACYVCGLGLEEGPTDLRGGVRIIMNRRGWAHELCDATDATEPQHTGHILPVARTNPDANRKPPAD